jgi:hypothetical protein
VESNQEPEDDGTAAATAAIAKAKIAEKSVEDKPLPLSILGLEAVAAIRSNALVVNDVASRMYDRLAPRIDLGFEEADIILFSEFGDEILRDLLYDLWLARVSKEKLVAKYYKGTALPAVHKTNRALNTDVVNFLDRYHLEQYGYARNLRKVIPGTYYAGAGYWEREARNVILTACRERGDLVRDFEMHLQQQRLAWEREDAFRKEAEAAKDGRRKEEDVLMAGTAQGKETAVKRLRQRLKELEERFDKSQAEQIAIRSELSDVKEMLGRLLF